MSAPNPRVSIIIPLKSGREIRYPMQPGPGQELLIVVGSNVSYQRNQGAQQARGEVLYFLDDDCQIDAKNLELALRLMDEGEWAAVGGPSLTHPQAGYWEHFFGRILSLRLATLVTQPRNWPVGPPREVHGAELITCNLLVRRHWFEKAGGFHLELHPSEDVEFVQRLRQLGGRLYYHPQLAVWRHRRSRLDQFLWQYFRYGVARGSLVWRTSLKPQGIYLLPLLLLLMLGMKWDWLLFLYCLLCVAAGAQLAWRFRAPVQGLMTAPVMLLLHLTYGVGVAAGLLAQPLGLRWSGPPQIDCIHQQLGDPA